MTRTLRLDELVIHDRLRTDLGDLDGLVTSIALVGLLQPLVVTSGNELIAGRRRLEALRTLGYPTVEVRDIGELSTVDRLRAELASDSESKPLNAIEHARAIVRLADAIEAGLAPPTAENSPNGGRPRALTGQVAEQLGISERTLQRSRQHVAAVEKHPDLARLTQAGALDEALRLERKQASEQEFEARADQRREEAVQRYPELDDAKATRANVSNAAAALDSLPPPQRERVREMVRAGALPVARVPDEVHHLTPIATSKRLTPFPMVPDAAALAAVVVEQHERKLAERQTELARWIGWTQDTAPIEAAAAIADEDVAVTLEHLDDAVAWVASVKAALSHRDAS